MALYLFMHDMGVEDIGMESLYEIKLPSLNSLPDLSIKPDPIIVPPPILEIPFPHYPRNMGSVQFGSVLYFFGGHSYGSDGLSPNDPIITDYHVARHEDFTSNVYCPKVYSFNTQDPTSGLQECPSMSTGKPSPYAFVARGMIYVLAGTVFSMRPYKLSDKHINRFERFNPHNQTWDILDDAPLKDISFFDSATVFENKQKVVIIGFHFQEIFLLVYDLDREDWDTKSPILISRPHLPYPLPYLVSEVTDGGRYVYGFENRSPVPIKLGPVEDPCQLLNLNPALISIVDTPTPWNTDPSQPVDWKHKVFPAICGRACMITHLDDDYFCHVTTVHSCPPMDDPSNCPHTFRVPVIIFKELSSQDRGGDQQNNSFRAKVLCVQHYVIKLPSCENSVFGGSFFVGRPTRIYKR